MKNAKEQIKEYKVKIKEFESKIKLLKATVPDNIKALNETIKKGGKHVVGLVNSGSRAKEIRKYSFGPIRQG